MHDEAHIASLVVRARPEELMSVAIGLSRIENLEIYDKSTDGKLVVVMEAPGSRELADRVSQIEATPHVISATLIYHHIDQPDSENETVKQENIPPC